MRSRRAGTIATSISAAATATGPYPTWSDSHTPWLWALREAGRSLPTAQLDYGDPRGSAELREVVAGYLRRVRASAADPERVVVCSG